MTQYISLKMMKIAAFAFIMRSQIDEVRIAHGSGGITQIRHEKLAYNAIHKKSHLSFKTIITTAPHV